MKKDLLGIAEVLRSPAICSASIEQPFRGLMGTRPSN
jgi:hypothetical protein